MSTARGIVKSVIICDDVRIEDNGKAILIGVYSGTITLRKMPTAMRLAFWLLGEVEGEGKLDFAVKAEFKPAKEGEKPFEATIAPFEMTVTDPFQEQRQDFQIALPAIPVSFSGPGAFTVSVRQPSETDYQLLVKKLVITSDDSSESAPPA